MLEGFTKILNEMIVVIGVNQKIILSRKDVRNSESTDLVQRNLVTEVTGQLEKQHMQIFEIIGLMGS